MPSLDSLIDDLYKGSLKEFVAARTKLAGTLKGAEAQRVKALKKPTVVPWAVNQLYWYARPVFDRLAKSGAALRTSQLAALAGRSANVRAATEAHRKAIAEAVAEASRLASRDGANPGVEALARMLEAVSLTPDLPDPPGRLVQTVAPLGFEALAGVAIKAPAHARTASATSAGSPPPAHAAAAHREEAERRRARDAAAAERLNAAAIRKAEAAVRRAAAVEARTRQAWERAQAERQRAANALAGLRDR